MPERLQGRLPQYTAAIDDASALKATFDEDGFIVLRGFFAPDELSELQENVTRFLAAANPAAVQAGTMKSLALDPWFRARLLGGKHVPLMKSLIDDKLSPDNVTWLAKPSGVVRTMPHFDALGTYRSPPSGASLWVALDQITAQNGCLRYEKGSHRRRYPDVYPLPGYDENNPHLVTIEAEPGDAVIHSASVVHFSMEPKDYSRPRNAAVFVYWAASSAIDPARARRSTSDAELRNITI